MAAGTLDSAGATGDVALRRAPRLLGRLAGARGAQLGIVLIAAAVLLAVVGPAVLPDPNQQDVANRLQPPAWSADGTWSHPLGTDELGRDLLSRAAAGGRVSLVVSLIAVIISGLVGVTVGLIAGYRGGLIDAIMLRLVDIQLAFPFVLLVVLVVGAVGPGLANLAIVLGATGWVQYARVVRAQSAALRSADYVRAGEVVGISGRRIALVHVLPNSWSAIAVIASFAVAQMVLWESALSFLGLGVQPPQVSWGMMLAGGREYMTSAPYLVLVPGTMITITVLGITLVGEWLRDVLDPRMDLVAKAS